MTTFDPSAYGPAFAVLLDGSRLAPLDPGRPDAARRPLLQALADDDAFRPHQVRDRDMAAACRAGLWLLHGFLDESHAISQELKTTEGSYWHALLHRREPDPDNSKYWFRRVGSHPVLQQLVEQASALGYQFTDPFAFVDFVERIRGTGSADEETARRVQRLEWELLFDYCFRRAI